MSEDFRDAELAGLLTREPVPDHSPDFWVKLEERLAAVDRGDARGLSSSSVAHSIEEAVRERGDVVRMTERGARGAREWVLAAAALVLIVAVTFGLRRTGDHDSVKTNQPPVTSAVTTPATTDEADAVNAATRFVHALSSGDVTQAATLIGPRSEEYLNATAGSVNAFLRSATGTFAAFGRTTNISVTAVTIRPGDYVVVFADNFPDATRNISADAIPVRHAESADAWFVDPWSFDPNVEGRIELVQPDPTASTPVLSLDQPVEVTRPAAGTFWFNFVGYGPDQVDAAAAGGPTVQWHPAIRPPGKHLLLATFVTDKTFTALVRFVDIKD